VGVLVSLGRDALIIVKAGGEEVGGRAVLKVVGCSWMIMLKTSKDDWIGFVQRTVESLLEVNSNKHES